MNRIILAVLLGGVLGGIVGYLGKCAGGSCPLACNPFGGIAVGAIIGFLLASSSVMAPKFTPSPNVIEITSQEQLDQLLKENRVALVDFNADWCGPCQMIKPYIHGVADEFAGKAAVLSVNVDKNGDVAAKYGVTGIPDVRVFKNGNTAEKIVGARSRDNYRDALNKLLGNPE